MSEKPKIAFKPSYRPIFNHNEYIYFIREFIGRLSFESGNCGGGEENTAFLYDSELTFRKLDLICLTTSSASRAKLYKSSESFGKDPSSVHLAVNAKARTENAIFVITNADA